MTIVPAQLPPRGLTAVKAALFLLCLVPAGLIVQALFAGNLGANPVEAMIRQFGEWGLRLLLVTLAVTPLRQLTGATWLIRLRRMLGLFAFSYVVLHFTSYFVFEQSAHIGLVVEDVVKRPYILVGAAALLMLIPLAVTSTNGWMRRLGRRWKQLHWLVYPIAILGVFHFFMLIKANDYSSPMLYAGILIVLLGYRLQRSLRGRLRRARSLAGNAPDNGEGRRHAGYRPAASGAQGSRPGAG